MYVIYGGSIKTGFLFGCKIYPAKREAVLFLKETFAGLIKQTEKWDMDGVDNILEKAAGLGIYSENPDLMEYSYRDIHCFMEQVLVSDEQWDRAEEYEEKGVPKTYISLEDYEALSADTIKWIKALFSEELVSNEGYMMYRGFTRREGAEVMALNLHYGDYTSRTNFFAYNDDELLIYRFCEGDTLLVIYPTKEDYERGKKETTAEYRRMYL